MPDTRSPTPLLTTTIARFCILIQGVDNPDQVSSTPRPYLSYDLCLLVTNSRNIRYHTPLYGGVYGPYAPSYTPLQGVLGEDFATVGFRECQFSEVRGFVPCGT